MRKAYLLLLALACVSILGALTAVSAFGADEWLLNGAAITTPKPAVTEGTIEITDKGISLRIACSIFFLGTVGPGKQDLVEKVEGLKLPEEEKKIDCTFVEKGACEGTLSTVEGVNLGWETEIILANEKFRDRFFNAAGNPGYEQLCPVGGVETFDRCTGDTSSEEVNVAAGVETIFDAKSEDLNCTSGGVKAGELKGHLLTTSSMGTLTVS